MRRVFPRGSRRGSRRFTLPCFDLIALFFAASIFAVAPTFPASEKSRGANEQCGDGVELRLIFPNAGERDSSQGDLLLLEVSSANPLKEISAHWNGREVPLWKVSPSSATEVKKGEHGSSLAERRVDTVDRYRALLGVDLEQAAGSYPLSVGAQIESNTGNAAGAKDANAAHSGSGSASAAAQVSCSADVAVIAGHFATERLHVKQQFVQPDPQQIARANEERKRLREIFDHITPERLWQGPFRMPLAGVTSWGNFGKRRILNGQAGSPHSGMDMPAPTGTPVFAPQRGRVVLAEPLYFSGNTVVIDHGLGIYTFYGHLSQIEVKPGELLEAGAILGKVGATGRATGPHLHWGLTVNRARVNPLEIVKLL